MTRQSPLTWCRLALLALTLNGAAAAALELPYLTGRVTDNAELFDAQLRERLGERLRRHEQATGNQVVVLTVPTLAGESVEDYAVRVFEAWQLGQKGRDNGVLVIIAPQDRRMRIEVGYGLEGTLTDLAASRIIREQMTPRFRDGDYAGGTEAGVAAIIQLLEGGALSAADPAAAAAEAEGSGQSAFQGPDLPLVERILFGGFIFGIIGLFTLIGILTPGAGWFLYLFLIPFWSMFPIIVVGPKATLAILVSYLLGYPLLKLLLPRTAWYRAKLKETGKTGGGGLIGFGSGSGGSSWSSGSSSGGSSGGFSGGGGSSGGGGASGSW